MNKERGPPRRPRRLPWPQCRSSRLSSRLLGGPQGQGMERRSPGFGGLARCVSRSPRGRPLDCSLPGWW